MPTRKNLNGQTSHTVGAESVLTVTIPDAESAPVKPPRTRKTSPATETSTAIEPPKTPRKSRQEPTAEEVALKATERAARREQKATLKTNEEAARAHKTFLARCILGSIIRLVVLMLLFLSLSHVAEAISLLTTTERWAAILFAIGIDLGMVCCETAERWGPHLDPCGLIIRGWKVQASLYHWVVIITSGFSMFLNTVAFWHHSNSAGGCVASVILGCFIPGLIFLLSRVASKLGW